MHAVVTRVAISDREGAESFLRDEVVPGVSQAPGFVAGYWVNIGGSRGTSVVVFESEEAANATAEQVRGHAPTGGAVTIESVDVGEVVASA
jgi:hypothetical protein